MKIFNLILTTSFLFFGQNVGAKEILGLNICGKVSELDVKKSIEKNGATISDEKNDAKTGVISIVSKDYNIADDRTEVEFHIYKNALYLIKFNDGKVVDGVLRSKYDLLRQENKDDGTSIEKIFFYNSKDKDIDIFQTYGQLSPSLGVGYMPWNTVSYLCKPVDRLLAIDLANNEKRKQLQKKGASQL